MFFLRTCLLICFLSITGALYAQTSHYDYPKPLPPLPPQQSMNYYAPSQPAQQAFLPQVFQPIPQPVPQIQNMPAPPMMAFQKRDFGKFYLGLGAGAFIPNTSTVELVNIGVLTEAAKQQQANLPPGALKKVNGTLASYAGTLEYNTGAASSLILGYHWTDWLASEAEFVYSAFETRTNYNQNGNNYIMPGGGEAYIFLANAVLTPFTAPENRFKPYVGAGVGAFWFDQSFSVTNLTGGTASKTNASFAVDGMAGFDYRLGENFKFGLRYQYLWTESDGNQIINVTTTPGTNPYITTTTATINDFTAHIVNAVMEYEF